MEKPKNKKSKKPKKSQKATHPLIPLPAETTIPVGKKFKAGFTPVNGRRRSKVTFTRRFF